MSGTSLQPQSANRSMSRRPEDGDPFMPLRLQMNRLFDDFFSSPIFPRFPMMPPTPTLAVVVTPQIEVSETDKEIQVTAELPGIDPKDIEITLADDVLTIRGEKQSLLEDGQDLDYHLTERSYGYFYALSAITIPCGPSAHSYGVQGWRADADDPETRGGSTEGASDCGQHRRRIDQFPAAGQRACPAASRSS